MERKRRPTYLPILHVLVCVARNYDGAKKKIAHEKFPFQCHIPLRIPQSAPPSLEVFFNLIFRTCVFKDFKT